MAYNVFDLELARRHVAEGAERVRNQQALIVRLEQGGHTTGEAETLLDLLVETQAEFERHLTQIEADLSAP